MSNMRRFAFLVSLMLMSGCGSCFDDKKVPEVEQSSRQIKTIARTDETGAKRRPVQVGESVSFAGIAAKLEAGAGSPDGG